MTFLLAARKRKKSKTANYVLSLDAEDINKHSNTYTGKVRANFIGTEFTVFDRGVSPESDEAKQEDPGAPALRQELVFCTYVNTHPLPSQP